MRRYYTRFLKFFLGVLNHAISCFAFRISHFANVLGLGPSERGLMGSKYYILKLFSLESSFGIGVLDEVRQQLPISSPPLPLGGMRYAKF